MPKPAVASESSVNQKTKLLGLDHLRAFAITFVFLFHYQFFGHPGWVNKIGTFGWTGVDLFFVLSGFLIAGQLFSSIAQGKKIPMREFFTKRVFRIIPPYLVMLALYALFPLLREREHFAPLWRYLTFTLNFGLDLKTYGTFTHAWSLCVEEQFYLVLPLTLWLFNFKGGKKAAYLLSGLFIAGFAARFFSWHYLVAPHLEADDFGALWNEFIYYPTYNRLDGLLTGVSIAGLFTFYPRVKAAANRHSNGLMVAGIIILTVAYFVGTPQATLSNTLWGYPLVAAGYGLVVAAAVCPSNILYKARSVITAQLAAISYGIYLSHKLIIHAVQHLLEKAGMDKNSNLVMLCCVTCCIAAALLLRYLVEKPSLKLRDRVLERWGRKNIE